MRTFDRDASSGLREGLQNYPIGRLSLTFAGRVKQFSEASSGGGGRESGGDWGDSFHSFPVFQRANRSSGRSGPLSSTFLTTSAARGSFSARSRRRVAAS